MEANISNPEHECDLVFAIQRFAEYEEYVDVVIKCRDSTLRAHKILLASVSSFLKDLFTNHDHKDDIVISLPDVRYNIMYMILNFLYTGFMKLDPSEIGEFTDVVNMLGIDVAKMTNNERLPKQKSQYQNTGPYSTHKQKSPDSREATSSRQNTPGSGSNENKHYKESTPSTSSDALAIADGNTFLVPAVEGEIEHPTVFVDPLDTPDFYFGVEENVEPSHSANPTVVTETPPPPKQLWVPQEKQVKIKKEPEEHIRKSTESRDVPLHVERSLREPMVVDQEESSRPVSNLNEEQKWVIWKYFKAHIEKEVVPRKEEAIQCIELHKNVLSNRTWEQIKSIVYYKIVKNKSLLLSNDVPEKTLSRTDHPERTREIRDSPKLTHHQERKRESREPPKSTQSTPDVVRRRWTEAERRYIFKCFDKFIKERRTPKRTECTKFVSENKEFLKGRDWSGVSKIVHFQIKKEMAKEGK